MTHSSSTFYFLVLLTILIRTYPSHAQHCYNAIGNFTSDSAYAKNRDAVLRSLPSNVAAHDGFYAASEGENPNTVYAITYCRGDTSADTCKVCVRTAVENLIVKCPNQKAAFSWGTADPPCFIRYSDSLIFGKLQTDPVIRVINPNKITVNQDQFHGIWNNLTRRLAGKAGEGSSKLKFAMGQADLPDNKTIYSLLQCSPDLSPLGCWSCLSESIDYYDKCCRARKGGVVYKPSCIFRLELFPFWESPLSSSPPPSSPTPSSPLPPSSSPLPQGGNIAKGILAAIIASAAGCCYLQRRRAAKKYEAQEERGVSEITSLESLRAATDNFSQENKLGSGGFGEVYQDYSSRVSEVDRSRSKSNHLSKNEVSMPKPYPR